MSSRTSGPTMTRAPASLRLARTRATTSSSPCAITSGLRVRRGGRGEEARLHRLGGAAVASRTRAAARARSGRTAAASLGGPRRRRRRCGGAVPSLAGGWLRRRGRIACGGAARRTMPSSARERMRQHSAATARGAAQSGDGGRSCGPESNLDVDESGDAADIRRRDGTRALSRRAGNIICGCHAARKSARPDAARARRPRQRRRDRGRGHARDGACCCATTASRRGRCRCTSTTKRRAPSRSSSMLRAGRSVALVSDAGTPAVSDPGARLVRAVRDAGLAGRADSRRERGDRRDLGGGARGRAVRCSWASCPRRRRRGASCSPRVARCRARSSSTRRRIACARTVAAARRRRSAASATLVVARELTKKFETIARMTLAEARRHGSPPIRIASAASSCCSSTRPAQPAPTPASRASDAAAAAAALVDELPPARAARVAAAATGLPRDALYAQALALKGAER